MSKVVLRSLREEDRDKVLEWRNRPHVAKFMYTDREITKEEHHRWFERAVADKAVKYWVIQVDGKDAGIVNLFGIDEFNKRCYWAFYIAEQELRGGIGSLVEYAVLLYVFDKLHFEKLCCEVLSFNEMVIALHKKFGFQEEGRFRQHVLKGNERIDVHSLGMLRQEWDEFKKTAIARRLEGKAVISDEKDADAN